MMHFLFKFFPVLAFTALGYPQSITDNDNEHRAEQETSAMSGSFPTEIMGKLANTNENLEPNQKKQRTGANLVKTLDMEIEEPADLFFNMPIDGPNAHIANFLDPIDRESFFHVNKNLQSSSMYFESKAFRIPFTMPSDELREMLPTLQKVGKIIVSVNIKHLLSDSKGMSRAS